MKVAVGLRTKSVALPHLVLIVSRPFRLVGAITNHLVCRNADCAEVRGVGTLPSLRRSIHFVQPRFIMNWRLVHTMSCPRNRSSSDACRGKDLRSSKAARSKPAKYTIKKFLQWNDALAASDAIQRQPILPAPYMPTFKERKKKYKKRRRSPVRSSVPDVSFMGASCRLNLSRQMRERDVYRSVS